MKVPPMPYPEQVTRRSPLTGQYATMTLSATPEQWAELDGPRERRRNIQAIVPHWTPAEREFYMTGYTDADWEAMFPQEKEGSDDAP